MMTSRSLASALRGLAFVLIGTTTMVCTLQASASATLIPAAAAPAGVPASPEREQDMRVIQKSLESKVLRRRLHEMGLSDQEIQLRLGKLSDRQVHQMATKIHSLNPGGDFTLFGVLILVVLVLFIIYLVKRI